MIKKNYFDYFRCMVFWGFFFIIVIYLFSILLLFVVFKILILWDFFFFLIVVIYNLMFKVIEVFSDFLCLIVNG